MRKELDDLELDSVTGGTVNINSAVNKVTFTSLGVSKDLKNCTAKQARALVNSLYDEYEGTMSEKEFDTLCAKELKARGWV